MRPLRLAGQRRYVIRIVLAGWKRLAAVRALRAVQRVALDTCMVAELGATAYRVDYQDVRLWTLRAGG